MISVNVSFQHMSLFKNFRFYFRCRPQKSSRIRVADGVNRESWSSRSCCCSHMQRLQRQDITDD